MKTTTADIPLQRSKKVGLNFHGVSMTRKMYTGAPLRITAKATNEGTGSDASGMMMRNSETTIIMTGRINHTCVHISGVMYILNPVH